MLPDPGTSWVGCPCQLLPITLLREISCPVSAFGEPISVWSYLPIVLLGNE